MTERLFVKSAENIGFKGACCMCKIKKIKPIQPIMGPLPEDCLRAVVRPFSYIGINYFGSVMVSVRRSHEKRIALFTCLNTRTQFYKPERSAASNEK